MGKEKNMDEVRMKNSGAIASAIYDSNEKNVCVISPKSQLAGD